MISQPFTEPRSTHYRAIDLKILLYLLEEQIFWARLGFLDRAPSHFLPSGVQRLKADVTTNQSLPDGHQPQDVCLT